MPIVACSGLKGKAEQSVVYSKTAIGADTAVDCMFLNRLTGPALAANSRERYYFALFRCLQAALLVLWVFSPFAPYYDHFSALNPLKLMSLAFMFVALAIFLTERQSIFGKRLFRIFSLDVLVFGLLAWMLPQGFESVSLLMLVNLAAAGLLLKPWQSTLLTFAAIGVLLARFSVDLWLSAITPDITQPLMYAAIYLSTVLFCQLLAKRALDSQALADERGLQLAEMAQMNELIIKRMRTGVILLDAERQIVLCNEAASQLCQIPLEYGKPIAETLPKLEALLQHWVANPKDKSNAVVLQEGGPELIPRFIRVNHHAVQILVFLEDSRVFSGRADELQLANLGRLSASIAHEIRNPLAAISYAQQLLSESAVLNTSDTRLLDIIGTQSQRMDGIITNVLKLAKREAAFPQILALNSEIERVLREHLIIHPEDAAKIHFHPDSQDTLGLFDALHLQQVLHILLSNALTYGHSPDKPARIKISIHTEYGQPSIDVIDHGPGIADAARDRLFSPFNTCSEHGTGLGLYIARQLAEANQAQLSYEPLFGGGSRFSLRLSNGHSLLVG